MSNKNEELEMRLYKMLSQYTDILSCVEKDYKPFVTKQAEMEISSVFQELFPNTHLRDWSCPSCALYNWKQFNKFYKKYKNG